MKIFISAGSKEFKHCRERIAKDLRMAGHVVLFHDEFTPVPGKTIIRKLEDMVDECGCFIALVGDVYGEEPYDRPLGSRRSYTQWEYFFACGERLNGRNIKEKPMFVYFAKSTFLEEQACINGALRNCLADEAKTDLKDRQGAFKA